ncbi:MAG TPA: hypothetical protein VIF57_03730 [Polyangia bacterium]
MRTSIPAIVIAAITLALVSAVGGAASSDTTISGGALAQAIRLTPVDEAALFQRINLPPKLDDAPEVSGKSYTVKSPYWPKVLPGNGKDRPAASDEAAYYPEGGFVRASQGGKDAWIVLDLRQRAILDRYVSLGEKHLISADPSQLDILRDAAATGDDVGVTAGARNFGATEAGKLWTALEGVNPRSFPAPGGAPATPDAGMPADATWITFLLPEGRDARLLYVPGADVLVDYVAQQYYPVPKNLLTLALGADGASGSAAVASVAVPQEKPPGSHAWWFIMLGGGVVLIAAALFLGRSWAKRKAEA